MFVVRKPPKTGFLASRPIFSVYIYGLASALANEIEELNLDIDDV